MGIKYTGLMEHRSVTDALSRARFILLFQIISPHDKGISTSIECNLSPWPTSWDTSILSSSSLISDPYPDIMDNYFQSLLTHCHRRSENANSKARLVYTAMHGVGWPFIQEAFKTFNLAELIPVVEQV